MNTRKQTSISTLLAITAVVAIWFGLRRIVPNVAWLLVGVIVVGSYSIFVRKFSRLFWLPLILCLNWSLLALMPWWTAPPDIVFLIGLGLLSLLVIIAYAITRTRRIASETESRDGVIFVGWGQSTVAGLFVALSIAMPIFIAGIFPVSPIPRFFIDRGIALIIALPFVGLFVGAALGVILGFVCDIIVGIDFKKRSHPINAG